MTDLDKLFDDIRDYQNRWDIVMKCISENLKTKEEFIRLYQLLGDAINNK